MTHAGRLPSEEARREANEIKGVYSRFILVNQKSPNFSAVKNIAKWTLTGMYIPIRAHSMPLGHGVGLGYYITA